MERVTETEMAAAATKTLVKVAKVAMKEVFTLPGLIHMESMDSTPPFHGFHMEWFWVRSQLFFGSMVTLDSIWNGHGMAME